jgi:hypothetical protein
MSTDADNDSRAAADPASPTVHVHNAIRLDNGRGWNVLVTFLLVAGLTAIAYQLSLGPLADVVATGLAMFTTTLVTFMFRAGILRLPETQGPDDLAFTKSTLRRIYDELTAAIVNSSMPRLILFAAVQTAAFLIFRAAVAFGLGLLSSMWMAIGVGLIAGALVVAQDQIWSWVRGSMVKRGNAR